MPVGATTRRLPTVTPAAPGVDRAGPDRVHAGLHPAGAVRRRQRGHRAGARRRGLGGARAPPAALLRRAATALRLEPDALGAGPRETIAAYEGSTTIAVNVAGCGSAMKDYGHLLADDPQWSERAAAFSAKVSDVHELLDAHPPQATRHPVELTVAYHDACHLAHAQGIRQPPRATCCASIPGLTLVEPKRVGAVLRLAPASTT